MTNSSWAWYVNITCPTSSRKFPNELSSDELRGIESNNPRILPIVLNSNGDKDLRKFAKPLKS